MKKIYSILAIVALTFAVSSCNKKGCSDPTADNYVKNVKKARDSKCEYNGEGICGVGVTFCFEIDGTKRTNGTAEFYKGKPGDAEKQILWTNGLPANDPNYEDVFIAIYGNDEDKSYSWAQSGNDKTFQASYVSGLDLPVAATSGNLTVKKDNATDGLIVTFNFTTQNGIQIKDGNIYKLKD